MDPPCRRLLPLPIVRDTVPSAESTADTAQRLTCSPLVDSSALTAVQTRLFTELVRDSLQEYAYDAELAGLSYNFDQQADGILLSADGYDDKLPLLIEVIVRRMKEYKVDEKRFAIVVDMVRRFSSWLFVPGLTS